MSGTSLTIASSLYMLIVIIVYFYKKRFPSKETKIYSYFLIVSFVGNLIGICTYIFMKNMQSFPILNFIFSRLYLVYILSWISLLTIYCDSIINKKTENQKIKKIIFLIIYSISFVLIFALQLNCFDGITSAYVYSKGPAANVVYVYAIAYAFYDIFVLIINYKNNNFIKYIPFISFIILAIASALIQYFFPQILIMTTLLSLISFIMYFTIENPDMKLIAQLNIAKEQADKANHAKTEFLSSMSHEIRTPLNAIVGFSEILDTEDIPPSSKEIVNDILSASDSLIEIVNGILDISKIEANKLEIVNTEYEFKKIFNDMVTLTKGRLGDKPLEFRYKYDETIPSFLYGDAVRLKQIVINLLTNSVKYTQHGYIELKVNSVINRNVCRLIISVEDSGIGIKPESINKLFSKFERLDVEKNASIEGTGLGLAITKKLVELMNGKIVVQSKYGEGSKFTVAIDQKVITTRQATEEKSESVVIDIHNKKVLVVDDNALNIKVACRLLSGYSIINEGVSSGQECIDKINNNEKFDLILLDDMMPKMSGTETFKKLREDVNFNTPVVILTANAISGMREKYIASGFDDYLAKPIEKLELERVIKKYLS